MGANVPVWWPPLETLFQAPPVRPRQADAPWPLVSPEGWPQEPTDTKPARAPVPPRPGSSRAHPTRVLPCPTPSWTSRDPQRTVSAKQTAVALQCPGNNDKEKVSTCSVQTRHCRASATSLPPPRAPISLTRRRLKPGCKTRRHRAGRLCVPRRGPWQSGGLRSPDV